MQVVVYFQYGSPDVLELREIDRPAAKNNEVLIRVRAAAANPQDWHYMRGLPCIMRPIATGLFKATANTIGSDVSGQVETVGSNVTRFSPGDEVFARVETGGFSEYVSFTEDLIGLKPANLAFEQAAAAAYSTPIVSSATFRILTVQSDPLRRPSIRSFMASSPVLRT